MCGYFVFKNIFFFVHSLLYKTLQFIDLCLNGLLMLGFSLDGAFINLIYRSKGLNNNNNNILLLCKYINYV